MELLIQKSQEMEINNDWQKALETYNELFSKSKNTSYLEKIGWCQSRLGLYIDAITSFQKVNQTNPKAQWDYMIGYQYYMLKDWENSIVWFKEALKKFPNYFIVRYRLGKSLVETCGSFMRLKNINYLEAFKEFTYAEQLYLKMNENNKKINKKTYSKVCFQKGKIFLERKDWANAIDCFTIAHEIDSNEKFYSYGLAKAYFYNGNYDKALSIINGVDNVYYIEELKADIYIRMNKPDEALAVLLKLINNRKKDYLYRDIANIYINLEQFNEAIGYLDNSLRINKANYKTLITLGELYSKLGYLLSAREFAKIAEKNNKYDFKTDNDDNFNYDQYIESVSKSKKIGKITKYLKDKGYGFVKKEDESYFLHISSVNEKFKPFIQQGIFVSFKVQKTNKGLLAIDVSII